MFSLFSNPANPQAKTPEQHEKKIKALSKNDEHKRKKLKALGVDYDFPGYVRFLCSFFFSFFSETFTLFYSSFSYFRLPPYLLNPNTKNLTNNVVLTVQKKIQRKKNNNKFLLSSYGVLLGTVPEAARFPNLEVKMFFDCL